MQDAIKGHFPCNHIDFVWKIAGEKQSIDNNRLLFSFCLFFSCFAIRTCTFANAITMCTKSDFFVQEAELILAIINDMFNRLRRVLCAFNGNQLKQPHSSPPITMMLCAIIFTAFIDFSHTSIIFCWLPLFFNGRALFRHVQLDFD